MSNVPTSDVNHDPVTFTPAPLVHPVGTVLAEGMHARSAADLVSVAPDACGEGAASPGQPQISPRGTVLVLTAGIDAESRRLDLADAGFAVTQSGLGVELIRRAVETGADGIVVAVPFADAEAVELVRSLRLIVPAAVIMFIVSVPGSMVVEILLEAGAHDVVARSVSSAELIARLRARLRDRDDPQEAMPTGIDSVRSTSVVRTGGLIIELDELRVWKHGEEVHLTSTEAILLGKLARAVGSVLLADELVEDLWSERSTARHLLRIYIAYLRQKLEDNPGKPQYFINRWGRGYQLALLSPELASR